MNLKAERAAALKAANDIADAAKAANRDLTDREVAQIEAHLENIKKLDERIEKAARGTALLERIAGAPQPAWDSDFGGTLGEKAGLSMFSVKGYGRDLARHLMTIELPDGRKAMPTDRVQSAPTTVDPEPIIEGRRQPTVFDLFDVRETNTPAWLYRRATRGDVNAAIVGEGQLKPTTDITFEDVRNSLSVFANVAGPISEQALFDYPTLSTFLGDELTYGLRIALEDEVFSGDGTDIVAADDTGKIVGKHFTGLLNASGVLDQPYSVDEVTTLAIAINRLEADGYEVGGVAMNPDAWVALTTRRNASGEFDLGGAIDAPASKVWGKDVRLSRGVPAGTAVVIAREAVAIRAGIDGLQIKPIAINDDQLRNRLRIRAEARWGLDLYRPSGIAVAHLAAA